MKHFKKLITCLSLLMTVTMLTLPVANVTRVYAPPVPKAAEPRAHSYIWLYTSIDGYLYKRLYDETTGEWASEWIPV